LFSFWSNDSSNQLWFLSKLLLIVFFWMIQV
jgi:hypothetical protein